MDLNDLYKQQQISIYMAEHALSQSARRAHGELASSYAVRIAGARCAKAPSCAD